MSASSLESTHRVQTGRRKRTASAAALHRPAVDALALPSLGAVVPEFAEVADRSKWAQIALLWLDAGYLPETAAPEEAHKLVRQAASNWLEQHCGDPQHLGFKFGIACSSDDILGYSMYRNADDAYRDDGHWFFYTVANPHSWRALGPKIDAIEAACPGLGQAVLHGLDLGGWRAGVPLLTVSFLRCMAERHLWYGLSEQDEWEDEVRNGGAEQEDIDLAFSPKRFDSGFPQWVMNPSPKLFRSRRLRDLAKGEGTVAEVAGALLPIARYVERGISSGTLEDTDLESAVCTAVLRWDHDDVVSRVIDDLDESLNQCECMTDLTGIESVPTDGAGFRRWLRTRTQTLDLIKQLDRLVELVSVPDKGA